MVCCVIDGCNREARYNGETKTSAEWSRAEGAKFGDGAIRNRVRRGLDHKVAVFG